MSSDLAGLMGGLAGAAGIFFMAIGVIMLVALLAIVSLWKIFTKAGQPGWAAIIPYYGYYVQVVKVARVSVWYFVVALVPTLLAIAGVTHPAVEGVVTIASLVAYVIVSYNMAKRFGKGIGYTIGLIILPFIFYPILAFGSATYQSDDAVASAPQEAAPQEQLPEAGQTTEQSAPEATAEQVPVDTPSQPENQASGDSPKSESQA